MVIYPLVTIHIHIYIYIYIYMIMENHHLLKVNQLIIAVNGHFQ